MSLVFTMPRERRRVPQGIRRGEGACGVVNGRIYSEGVDATLLAMGLTILKTPGTSSERSLRTRDRHHSPRVPGLDDRA
jgi:hypothetical protein